MKKILLALSLLSLSAVSFAMEMEGASQIPFQTRNWVEKGRGEGNTRYIPLGSNTLDEVIIYRTNRSFPELSIYIKTSEELASSHSDLYKNLRNLVQKYGLDDTGAIKISRSDGEVCLHESLRLINSHIPLTQEMVEEICRSMGAGNPFICDKIPQLCEEWFQEIDQAYSSFKNKISQEDIKIDAQAAQEEQYAKILSKQLISKAEEKHKEASHLDKNAFLYPLAEKCEAKYGLDDYLTTFLYGKIIENNPQDYDARKKVAELTLVNGLPRNEAINEGTQQYLDLPKRDPDVQSLLSRYWNQRAGGYLGEDRLKVDFQQTASQVAVQALTKACALIRENEILKQELSTKEKEIEELKSKWEKFLATGSSSLS